MTLSRSLSRMLLSKGPSTVGKIMHEKLLTVVYIRNWTFIWSQNDLHLKQTSANKKKTYKSWTVMDYYGLLTTVMDYYVLLWTVMDYYGL